MVRAFGRPALPVLLAFGLCTATARGGVMSVAEVPDDGGRALVNPNVIIRITSASFQTSGGPDDGADSAFRSAPSAQFATSSDSAGNIASTLTPPEGYRLAASSVITMAGRAFEVHYFTVSGDLPTSDFPTGGETAEAAPNPEPAGIALFCIGATGLAGYVWHTRRRRHIA